MPGTPERSASKALIASFCGFNSLSAGKPMFLFKALRSVPLPVSSRFAKACDRLLDGLLGDEVAGS